MKSPWLIVDMDVIRVYSIWMKLFLQIRTATARTTSKSTAWLLDSKDCTRAITNSARRFPCVVCNKSIQVYRMKRHMRTHADDRPYSCDICGRRFLESRHLVEHARTHSGDRPFACYVCSQQFGRAGNQWCSSFKNNGDVTKFKFNCYLNLSVFTKSEICQISRLIFVEFDKMSTR